MNQYNKLNCIKITILSGHERGSNRSNIYDDQYLENYKILMTGNTIEKLHYLNFNQISIIHNNKHLKKKKKRYDNQINLKPDIQMECIVYLLTLLYDIEII